MRSLICLAFLLLSSCSYKTSQEIHTIQSFSEVDFDSIEQEAMVIFDVDQVLIERSCKVFWTKTEQEHEQWLNQLYDKVFNEAKHDPAYYLSIMLKEDTPIVIEPIIINIIHALQNRGVTAIALTTTNTGSCFTIPSLTVWRYDKLKEVGIDFSNVTISNMEFPELPSTSPEENGQYPIFYNGILFTSEASKGAVLTAFFEHTKLKPSRVIFFDDKKSNLESVSQAMHALDIPFEGYEYQGGQHMSGEIDKDVAQYQLHYLVDNKKWLGENEAKRLMSNQARSVKSDRQLSTFPLDRT